MSLFFSFAHAAQVGDIISNSAEATYRVHGVDRNTTSNEVNVTVAQTEAVIVFLQYDSGGTAASLRATQYRDVGGVWRTMPPARLPDGSTVIPPSDMGMSDTNVYFEDDLVLIRLTDIDQDTNASARETVEVNVTNPGTGDIETLTLQESTPNSGIFIGYIHTVPAVAVSGDGDISVNEGDTIEVRYIDNGTLLVIADTAEVIATAFRLLVTKEQSKDVASIGEFLKYTVITENIGNIRLDDVLIEDQLPDGIKYQKGSFRVAGVKHTLQISSDGKRLSYTHSSLAAGATIEVSYVVLITAGIIDKQAVNNAWASAPRGGTSNVATVTLKIIEELHRSRGFILGQVYDADMPHDSNYTDANATRKYGVEGVKLYMEDGRFVVTDKQGKYHFVDVINGSHVVQIDEQSIKGRYELAQCRNNTRFAGSKRSQFIDMYHGGLKRADFCLKRLSGVTGVAGLSLSIAKKSERIMTVTLELTTDMPLIDPEVFIAMPEGLEYITGSISSGEEPSVSNDLIVVSLGEERSVTLEMRTVEGTNPDKELRAILYFDTRLSQNQRSKIAYVLFTAQSTERPDIATIHQSNDTVTLESAGGNAPIESGDYSWTKPTHQVQMPQYTPDEVEALGTTPRIVWPPEKWIPDIPSTRVAILYPTGHTVELRLNGAKVSMLNYEGLFRSADRKMRVMHYKGVDLHEGENIFTVHIKRGNSIIKTVTQNVYVESRAPAKIEFLPEYSYLLADGKHSPIIAVRFTGQSGHLLRGGMVGSYTTDSKHTPQVMSNNKGQYRIDSQGIAYIKLKPTAVSGEATLQFRLANKRKETLTVRLKPHMRDWILVGFSEGTVGYSTLHGNKEALGRKGVNEKWHKKGRVAFFAKGQIKGKWLLTMAYDTGKQEGDRELFDKIDSDAYYTLYHDATKQGNEAASTKKLYLKIERDAFSLLFGDYATGLSKTELASYSRSFTGVKTEYYGTHFDVTAFGAETKELHFRDEVRGDGTAGYYYMTQTPIIQFSETVTIEVHDRHREEIIVSTTELQRYRDYTIDYEEGKLYFKDPVYSTDRAFNPRYIIVQYEVEGDGKKHYTFGGRAALKSSDGAYQAGSTYIQEENGRGKNRLYGVDATVKLGTKTEIKAEFARSKNDIDGNATTGDAAKLTLEYRDDNRSLRAYYRKQDASFGLGQLSQNLSATRKIGADASQKLSQTWQLNTTTYQNRRYEENGTTNDEHVFETGLAYHDQNWSSSFGYRYAKNDDTKPTHQLVTKIGRAFKLLDNNLSIGLSYDQSLKSNEDKAFPTKLGVDAAYQYDKNTTLFGVLERTNSDGAINWQSRTGLTYKIWKDGKINLTRLYESGEDGSRTYDTMGVSHKLVLKEKWSLSVGYEKGLRSDEENSSDDFDAFNAGIGYKGENYSTDLKTGYRHSNSEEKLNIDAGLYVRQSEAVGLGFGLGHHREWSSSEESRDINAKLAFVYRPVMTNWILLDRLDYIDAYDRALDDITQTRKFVNNLHGNWQSEDSNWTVGFQYGLKHVTDEIDSESYRSWTDLSGLDVTYDFSEKFSVGVQGSVLHSYTGENLDYGWGAFVGTTVGKNAELTVGYNIGGFDDEEFSQQNYHHEGPYLRFRMKFDQESVKDMVKGVLGE